MRPTSLCLALLAIFSLNCSADGDESEGFGGDTADESRIEIIGYWTSNFGETEVIDAAMWGDRAIISFDNEYNYAVLQNPEDAEFFPGMYSRVVWTDSEYDSFYYCTVDFGKETLEDAELSEKTADASDPEHGGCGDFAWTKLSRE